MEDVTQVPASGMANLQLEPPQCMSSHMEEKEKQTNLGIIKKRTGDSQVERSSLWLVAGPATWGHGGGPSQGCR